MGEISAFIHYSLLTGDLFFFLLVQDTSMMAGLKLNPWQFSHSISDTMCFFNPWDASSRGSQSRRRTELPSTGQWGQPQWVPGAATQTIRQDDNALVVVKTWLILNEAVYAKLNMLWQGNKKKSCFPFIKKSQFFPPQSCQIQENNRVDQQKNHPTKV